MLWALPPFQQQVGLLTRPQSITYAQKFAQYAFENFLKYFSFMLFTFPIMSVLCSNILANECSIKILTFLLDCYLQVCLL